MKLKITFAAMLLMVNLPVFANCTDDELLTYINEYKTFASLEDVPTHAKNAWKTYCDYEKATKEQQRLINLMKTEIVSLETINNKEKKKLAESQALIEVANQNIQSQNASIEKLQENIELYSDTETVRQIAAIVLGVTTLYLKSDLDSNATTLDMLVYGLGGYGGTLLLDDVTGRTVSTTIASWKF